MKRKSKSDDPTLDASRTDRGELGPGSAGQSGDVQGISGSEDEDAESVRELLEEGQYFEAATLSGIENAPPADESQVKTREVPEDDVPFEYIDEDERPSR